MKQLYKVHWLDICSFVNKKPEKPYRQYLAKCTSIGYILKDKDTLLVINGDSADGEMCGDAIPLRCVIKLEKL